MANSRSVIGHGRLRSYFEPREPVSIVMSAADAEKYPGRERTSRSRGRAVRIRVLPLFEQLLCLFDQVLCRPSALVCVGLYVCVVERSSRDVRASLEAL